MSERLESMGCAGHAQQVAVPLTLALSEAGECSGEQVQLRVRTRISRRKGDSSGALRRVGHEIELVSHPAELW